MVHKINSNIKNTVLKYKKILLADDIKPLKFILFGSQVNGKAKQYSDIDICVVSDKFSEDDINEYVRLRSLSRQLDKRIEPHPFRPEDFDPQVNPLASEINKTGIAF